MTKSTITRERLQEIAEDGFLKHGESKELARMALAAMNSEPVTLQPELAKVIYHFRDWNEGFPVERFKADYIISWMLANYPPAQPAPVVSAELLHTAASAIEDLLTTKDRTGACVWFDLPFRLRSAANAQPAPVVPDDVSIFEAAIEECKKCDSIDEHAWNHGVLAVIAKYESCRAAMLQELKKVQELKRSAGVTKMCRCCTPNLRRNPIAARRKTASLRRKTKDGFR